MAVTHLVLVKLGVGHVSVLFLGGFEDHRQGFTAPNAQVFIVRQAFGAKTVDLVLLQLNPFRVVLWVEAVEPKQFDVAHERAEHAVGGRRYRHTDRGDVVLAGLTIHGQVDQRVKTLSCALRPFVERSADAAFLAFGNTDDYVKFAVLCGVRVEGLFAATGGAIVLGDEDFKESVDRFELEVIGAGLAESFGAAGVGGAEKFTVSLPFTSVIAHGRSDEHKLDVMLGAEKPNVCDMTVGLGVFIPGVGHNNQEITRGILGPKISVENVFVEESRAVLAAAEAKNCQRFLCIKVHDSGMYTKFSPASIAKV